MRKIVDFVLDDLNEPCTRQSDLSSCPRSTGPSGLLSRRGASDSRPRHGGQNSRLSEGATVIVLAPFVTADPEKGANPPSDLLRLPLTPGFKFF